MIKILDENKEVVFSRKLILFEDLVTVPIQVKRARVVSKIETKQNLDFTIRSNSITFQNPMKNVKVLLMQNGNLNTGIQNVVPQYTIGNDLIYKYDTETQFWAGNEYLYFENKDIKAAGNNIAKIDSNTAIYGSRLFTNAARANFQYSNNQDVNGNFVVKNINSENSEIEADYAWVYFSLSAPTLEATKTFM